MAVVQSTYSTAIPNGFPGMIANGETSNRISRTIEDVAGIGWGKAVFRGAGDHGCTGTPSAALLGISIANPSTGPGAGGIYADTYAQYHSVGILTQGQIWVTVGSNVTPGQQAYVTSGGVITSSSSGNTILTGWLFDDTVASGGLARIAKR